MAKKQFKTESKKLLDMMINSIYTHKEIFLRELISNASDAIDKLYFRSLTDSSVPFSRDDYEIRITADKENRILTVSDNGCGMTKDELEHNLGTIAKSGSFDFKKDEEQSKDENIDIIGQFGVGFYSAFMVCDKITVESLAFGETQGARWQSSGVDGYTVESCEIEKVGTTITMHLKENAQGEDYDQFLESYKIRELVKKYSDYIRYPVRMMVEHQHKKEGAENEYETHFEYETFNSMVPIWKKDGSEVTAEEYQNFYRDKFMGFDNPVHVIRQKAEGTSNYIALMFVPSKAPFDYYSRDFEKGLKLYSSGVLITEKCKELLPDHYSFIKGLVDSADLSLNISRETLQHDRQLKVIAKALEKKITAELTKLLKTDREKYEEFFKEFGVQLKYGIYSDYGLHKDKLKDLILFTSSTDKKYTTLEEYTTRAKDGQEKIYYASGETVEQILSLPKVDTVMSKGYEVLLFTDDIDEFAVQVLQNYSGKEFCDVNNDDIDFSTDEEKETLKKANEDNADMLKFMKESIGESVFDVRFTNALADKAVCLSTEGPLSFGMEKAFSKMPGANGQIKAQIVLEVNLEHPVVLRLKDLYNNDRDTLSKYSKIIYSQARLVSGLPVDNCAEISDLVFELMVK